MTSAVEKKQGSHERIDTTEPLSPSTATVKADESSKEIFASSSYRDDECSPIAAACDYSPTAVIEAALETLGIHDDNLVIEELLSFIEASPTAWHATREAVNILKLKGFEELREQDKWELEPGKRYVVTRNGSSFIAFVMPNKSPESVCVLGAHTDSPGLKLKPNPEQVVDGVWLLNPEIYGGPILSTWFDRKLGLAGRITFLDEDANKKSALVSSAKTVGTISHVAIHLERELLDQVKINAQEHLRMICSTDEFSLESLLKEMVHFNKLIGHELFFVPREKPEVLEGGLILSQRLDNLLGTHASLQALINTNNGEETRIKMIACWDNEEIGSDTAQGAGSNFLPLTLERITSAFKMTTEERAAMFAKSGLISIDVAHARHPNYMGKHEPDHAPHLGAGIVVKTHANQSYATGSESEAWIYEAAAKGKEIPIQKFCIRSDTRCGSTIGNIVATQTGMRTVDIGAPVLAMHSILEKGHASDHHNMIELLERLLILDLEIEQI